ncbi:MAG: altronate dehydratase [Anaerolineae bacterium]|nr:altronate dehydratase [Anaerolineae bacterium]
MHTDDNRPILDLSRGAVPLEQVALRLSPLDDVAIAKIDLQEGTILAQSAVGAGPVQVPVRQLIPSGHKIALQELAAGESVRRYGQTIGFASRPILAGEHIHTHNLDFKGFARDYAFGVDVRPVSYVPESQRRTFPGYLRADGRVGTRNYIAIISTVNCSAHAAREIARHFTAERLAPYSNVDGVIALTHSSGCSLKIGGQDYVLLQRTLAGMARHPNVGAYVLVGLGCEGNQISYLIENYRLDQDPVSRPPLGLVIQDLGGVRKTVQAGIAAVKELLPVVNAEQRAPQPLSGLMVALQCGGSDSWSGVTANPSVGLAADRLVEQGGTIVLAETPEIYGAEPILTRRAINAEVGRKLMGQVRWWEEYTQRLGIDLDNNPTPGNKAGGLTTIYEKSLGAVAKAGSTPLNGVYEYAEPVVARGFTFMNAPGNDWISVTGQVAGGCNLVVFTTGRGSAFGFKPAPTLKVCSNSTTFERMADDMDLNAGRVLEGTDINDMAAELFELILAVASGQPSKSEAQGIGEAEFCPWNLGGVL